MSSFELRARFGDASRHLPTMSKFATGSVVDENGRGLEGLGVVLEDISSQYDYVLRSTVTVNAGNFSLSYADDPFATGEPEPGKQVRRLRLRIRLGQLVLKEVVRDDLPFQDTLTFDPIRLNRAEAESWWATLGSGRPSRLTHGNAIRWLADNVDGWGHVAGVIKRARTLDVMQLTIDVERYHANKKDETPVVVLQFDPNHPDPVPATDHPVAVIRDDDDRIERLLLERSKGGVDVRIQIPRMTLDARLPVIGTALFIVVALILIAPFSIFAFAMVTAGFAALIGSILGNLLVTDALHEMFGEPKLETWFKDAGSDASRVRLRELRLRSLFVTHAKIIIDREQEAILLGSPFEQVYFDTFHHDIDEPKRGGDASKGPIHDVSVGVRGPAVGHLQELLNSHWNIADPTDPLPMPPRLLLGDESPPGPQTSVGGDEFAASVQVVRTLDRMFSEATDGEKGVLEAYLRAIHFAERFIYIENQYFNNDTITQALIDALRAKPDIVVILLVNVGPDMPCYPGWQQNHIRKIRDSLGDKAAAKKRFGVFTPWTHAKAGAGHTKPRLLDIYLHTKTAIIDNRWATVGSANLDGASLDFVQYGLTALGIEVRNTEANVVVLEDAEAQTSAVDALRRRLWAEHLGVTDPRSNELSPTSDDLKDLPGKNWLEVWNKKADEKVAGLMSNLGAVSPVHVLPWPSAPFKGNYHKHAAAKSYLDYLFSPDEQPSEVLESQFDLVPGGPPSFRFKYQP